MTSDEEKVQKALDLAMKHVRDTVADPRHRAILFTKLEEVQLMHKGLTVR